MSEDLPLFGGQEPPAPPAEKKAPVPRCPDCRRPVEGKPGGRCTERGDADCRRWSEWHAVERLRLHGMLAEAKSQIAVEAAPPAP